MDSSETLNLGIGILQIVLALVVLRRMGRFGRAFPWLAVLMAFFFVRGIDRIYSGVSDGESLGLVVDLVIVACLVTLLVGIDRTIGALRASREEAEIRTEEYERALTDYRRLARHRLANPITAIRGSITTLRDLPDLDSETREELLEAIDSEARRLEQIALEPEPISAEERGLRPAPELGGER